MIRSRSLLFGLSILLLILVGTGFYVYRNLPNLLRQQALHYLQQYGVNDIAYSGLSWADREVRVASLALSGSYGNFAYQASLTSTVLHYDWRMLLDGEISSLAVTGIDIAITAGSSDDSAGPATVKLDRILPQHLLAQQPFQSILIKHWTLDYRAPGLPVLTAKGSLRIDPDLHLSLATALAGRDIAVDLNASADTPGLDLSLSIQEQKATLAAASVKLVAANDARWEWEWQVHGNAHYAPVLAWLQQLDARHELDIGIANTDRLVLQGESVLDLEMQHANELQLASAESLGVALLRQIRASIHLHNTLQRLDIASFTSAFGGILEIDGTYDSGQLVAKAQPFNLAGDLWTGRLALPEELQRWLGWNATVPLSLAVTEPLHLARSDAGAWTVQAQNALLTLGEKDTRIQLQKLNLDATVTGDKLLHATTRLGASLNTRLRKQTLPQLELALTQRGSMQHSEVGLRVADTAESFDADIKGTLDLHTGAGTLLLDARVTDLAYLTDSTVPVLRHFDLLATEVELRSGSVQLTSAIKSEDFDISGWEQQSQVRIRNVSGTWDEYRFDGLSLGAEWSGITHWKTHKPLELSLAKLHTGFAIADVYLRVSLPKATPISTPSVLIETFTAGMFGGEVFLADAQSWDFSAASNQMTLSAKNWQLGELVALQPNADIRAQGILEGELPIELIDGRLVIENGYLRARPPGGYIRYLANEKSRALAGKSPELALAIDLLSDFQYQSLSSEVQLDKAGNLLLDLSLAGNNPTQYQGQAINFNINLEQNLDPLLQSLRLSDNVSTRIERQMK